MLRKLIMLSVGVGLAGAVPGLYQKNPEFYQEWLHILLGRDAGEEKADPGARISVSRTEIHGGTDVMPGRKVRITADQRGHFTGEFKLNGHKVTALVDTGATFVAINKSLARRIGIKLSASDFKYKVSTANGETRAAAATIESVQIGRIYVDKIDVVVLDDDALDNVLVGMNFLNRIKRFGVEQGALVLEQ